MFGKGRGGLWAVREALGYVGATWEPHGDTGGMVLNLGNRNKGNGFCSNIVFTYDSISLHTSLYFPK